MERSPCTIRRRAGIEYETSIEAREPGSNPADDKAGLVAQDHRMLDSGHGWAVDSDNSKLEFVTDPPVELSKLEGVVTNMLDHIEKIPIQKMKASETTFKEIFPDLTAKVGKDYRVRQTGLAYFRGDPQGTIGIPFEQLYEFFDILCEYDMKAGMALQAEYKDRMAKLSKSQKDVNLDKQQAAVDRATELHPRAIAESDVAVYRKIRRIVEESVPRGTEELKPGELEKLKGFLHFFLQYAYYSTTYQGTTYKKVAFPVMTRSSFTSMYQGLSDRNKEAFPVRAPLLLRQMGIEPEDMAFPKHGPVKVGEKVVSGTSFSIDSWIKSFLKPVKYLHNTGKKDEWGIPIYEDREGDRMSEPGAAKFGDVGAWETDRSMGSMGLDDGLVVVELRTLKHFTGKVGSYSVGPMRQLVGDLAALVNRSAGKSANSTGAVRLG